MGLLRNNRVPGGSRVPNQTLAHGRKHEQRAKASATIRLRGLSLRADIKRRYKK